MFKLTANTHSQLTSNLPEVKRLSRVACLSMLTLAALSFGTGCSEDGSNPIAPDVIEEPGEIHSVDILQSNLSLEPGAAAQLEAVLDADEDVEDMRLSWSSSAPNVVQVDAGGKITAMATGTATVTALAMADAQAKDSILITVSALEIATIDEVKLNETSADLYENDDFQLEATVLVTGNIDRSVRFESSNTQVATVDASGMVKALRAGSARITATSLVDASKSASMGLTVQVRPMEGHPIKAWEANMVEYVSADRRIFGSFTQVWGKEWLEQNNQGTNDFVETDRDEWSVYLHDASRNVTIQLDLWLKLVKIAPYNSEYIVTNASTLPVAPMEGNSVKGWDADYVQYEAADRAYYGHFVRVSGNEWHEENNRDTNTFVETGRDEWSVYLYDANRGVSIQLDLWLKLVKIAPYNSEYIVTDAN